MAYSPSRYHTVRRHTVEVNVGGVLVGGLNPVRVQSMTTSDTQDVPATVKQSIALAEVGCEIVRITAPNVQAARCLKDIRRELTAAGFGSVPLVADIHFLPQAAMEAVEHVEKIRVNPGNYADKKKFAVKDYSDNDYELELERLHETFSPLVKRCKELGRAMRIGTNHGSLSDRVMNRYGDTPLGMVESALEFLRIAESHDYRQIILSMKSSNPKVMIQAYRLLVDRMAAEDMHYPLHLGVTEAGDGEDGRIKGSIGIGTLLMDGLGDTLRVSLTEDSVYEVPVARAIADKAMSLWHKPAGVAGSDGIDPYQFVRRVPTTVALGAGIQTGAEQPPRVLVRTASAMAAIEAAAALTSGKLKDTPVEGIVVPVSDVAELSALQGASLPEGLLVLDLASSVSLASVQPVLKAAQGKVALLRDFASADELKSWLTATRASGHLLAASIAAADVEKLGLRELGDEGLIVTCATDSHWASTSGHALGSYRRLADALGKAGIRAPLWIRNTAQSAVRGDNTFLSKLIEASILTGGLLCDGLGDIVTIETEADVVRSVKLSYNVLQGAGSRISKTEFISCPSCGRTLFDLQTTTQRIREKTGHLKGVKLAIMGCIVNGPGEMADADFGYVGGAPGKINLYVGKQCVQYNIPQAEADARLIALIKEHGKWLDPEPAAV